MAEPMGAIPFRSEVVSDEAGLHIASCIFRYSRIARHHTRTCKRSTVRVCRWREPNQRSLVRLNYTPLDRGRKERTTGTEPPQLTYGGTLNLTFVGSTPLYTQILCKNTEVFIPLNEADATPQTSLHPLRQHILSRSQFKSHERSSLHRAVFAC